MTEYRANDPVAVGKRKDKAKEQLEQQLRDLQALLKISEFRRYVWRHMNETCGLMISASSPNGSIQSQNIGMQDVARKLWVEIEKVDPLAIPQMMTEYHQSHEQA